MDRFGVLRRVLRIDRFGLLRRVLRMDRVRDWVRECIRKKVERRGVALTHLVRRHLQGGKWGWVRRLWRDGLKSPHVSFDWKHSHGKPWRKNWLDVASRIRASRSALVMSLGILGT